MIGSPGFSLIEVLLATLILGLTLAGLTEAMTASLRSSKDAEEYTMAVLLAESRLEELRVERGYVAGESEGEFASFPRYEYVERIEETDKDGLFLVRVSVRIKESETTLYLLETLLFELPFSLDSYPESGIGGSGFGDGIEEGR